LEWEGGELRELQGATTKKVRGVVEVTKFVKKVPAAYHRLVCQLVAEITHATSHSGHEAQRRCSYAMEVLDLFAEELFDVDPVTPAFRSGVLTPILQRQLCGVPDHYTPSVIGAIASDGETVTLGDSTKFYLREDPTGPECIPAYRRNLIYIPEARWHLGTVVGSIKIEDAERYNEVQVHQDVLMRASKEQESEDDELEAPPEFSAAEVMIIVQENLDEYFAPELSNTVRRVISIPGVVSNTRYERIARTSRRCKETRPIEPSDNS
jgi:hypothetical protein